MSSDDTLQRSEAVRRAQLVDDVAYDVALDLTGGDRTFRSHAKVTFACREPGSSTFVDLVAAQVESATLNGRPVPPQAITDGRLRLDGLAEGNTLEVTAICAYERTGVGLHRFVDPVDGAVYLHTQFEPFDAHRVYACFDQPDLKAPFTLSVRAPTGQQVIGNAPVTERTEDGDATRWTFAPTAPISTYLTAVVAGPFHQEQAEWRAAGGETVPLGLYCRRSLAEHLDAGELFEITRQGLDLFTRLFGTPYPFGKYDQLFVPEFNWGGMENVGCVTYSERYVFRSRVTDAARQARAETLLHELAHMWFGNLVTMRWWDDLWLNESFATFTAYHALVNATRFGDAWAEFGQAIKGWALNQDQLPTTHPIAADIPTTDAVRTNFDGITYAKGASVLRQLVAWVGEDAFFAGLRDYFARHAFSNATLGDFLVALEKSSGRPLAEWSQQWLETAGVNTLRPELEVEDGRHTRVTVAQEANGAHPTLRSHRVALACYRLDGEALVRDERIELDVTGAETHVDELRGVAVADLLLPNDGDLAYAKVRLDDRSVQTLLEHCSGLADPVARSVSWGAAWDMTRDAELPARDFVALVARHAAAERDLTLLRSLHTRARLAATLYGDPANRPHAREVLADAARSALEASAAGSDHQLAWLRHLVVVGDGPDHLRFVEDLLEGRTEVSGVTLDPELRWTLLIRLAWAGAVRTERIAEEQERDATDMGARSAATARASLPDAAAKQTAWEALTADRDLPLATLRATAQGFWRADQEALLQPYVDRFAESIRRLWSQGRVVEEALALTRGLYPSVLVSDQVAEQARRLAADPTLPETARRTVIEAEDGTRRALAARTADRRD